MAGTEERFAQVYERYGPSLYRFCLIQMKHQAGAEHVALPPAPPPGGGGAFAAKRTKPQRQIPEKLPDFLKKPLDTHGRVLYDNEASEKGAVCDDAGDCSGMR